VGSTARTSGADGRLSDAARLRRLRDTGLLDGVPCPSLDRLARAAAHQVRAARGQVALVAADRRVVAGIAGPPLRHSLCRIVVDTDAPLLVSDARTDDRVAGHPAVGDGVIAYAGFPLHSADGYPLGSFCVLHDQPRDWEPRALLLVEDLAAAAEAELELRAEARRQAAASRRLQGVLDACHDAYVSIDVAGNVLAWNAAAERVFGYPAGAAVGRSVAELIVPDRFRDAHLAGLARLHDGSMSALTGQRIELAARNRAGDEFPIEMTLQIDRDGAAPVFHAFLHDISDRVANRRQLEHERTFLEALLDSLDAGVAACDADGRLTLFNTAMRKIHGADARPVRSGEWTESFDLYGPDGRTPLPPEQIPLARAYGGERVDRQHLVVARPDAPRRTFQCNARAIETGDGRRLGAVVAMHDITDQCRAETQRELRLAVARALADAASAEEAANRAVAAVARALGWPFAEFWLADDECGTITRVGQWISPDHDLSAVTTDRPFTLARGVGLAGHIWADDTGLWASEAADDPRLLMRGEQIREAGLHSLIGVPVHATDRILGVLLLFSSHVEERDPELLDLLDSVCTSLGRHFERRRAEDLALALAEQREQLLADQREQNAQLRRLDRLKDELVALVSHELRNPLGVIRSYTETLLEDPELSGDQRHLTETIDRRSAHMQHLVDDLLDMARLEAGKLHIDPKPMSAARLLRDVAQSHRPAADAKALAVSVTAPRHLPAQADPDRLRQVFDNLLSNAIKYTPAGGRVTVAARHDPPSPGGGGLIAITFTDTGIGVPADQYPHLFDRFFRASNAVSQGIKGTGLGLAISRAIIEAHGGTLTAAPAPGGGSVFTVTLPAP
jgi:PAS domain S-box-containing protein